MQGTLFHTQSQLITRTDLKDIAPPPATATWKPIAHYDLIHALDRQLLVRDIRIVREQFAIQREGARLFAVLDLGLGDTDGMCAAIGIRTANDRSMALEIAVGVRVFVCDNMTFSGDLIALRRKHTSKFDLNADLSRAVDRYQGHLVQLQQQIAGLRESPIDEQEAKAMIVDAFRRDILPLRSFRAVTDAYFEPMPEMDDVHPRTMWALHNAFTRAVRQLAPGPAFAATVELGKFFGLTAEI